MTKFEELCTMYSESRNGFFDDENKCKLLTMELFNKFGEYLNCPKEQIEFYPSKKIKEKYESDDLIYIH